MVTRVYWYEETLSNARVYLIAQSSVCFLLFDWIYSHNGLRTKRNGVKAKFRGILCVAAAAAAQAFFG